ncbi:MAG: DUF547 domain-containing protein [Deltaproteobacteria bacterium]|nr:DUF547 domain-containing protein [Deltaproteobacteria bacterium]
MIPVLLGLIACRESMYPKVSAPSKEPVAEYEALLAAVVTEDGFVDYDALEADREPLDRYVAWLANGDPIRGKNTNDHHATWLNAYNALVLYQVLERGRPASVLDVDVLLPIDGAGFFYETQFNVEDDWLSLAEIESERIRWMELDHRDHAALNCASRSCPPLRSELYRREKLEAQLRDQMKRWVDDDRRGVRIEGKEAVFNPIFEWYARDFDFFSAGKDICEIAANFAERKKATKLLDLSAHGCPHRFFTYDWSLNDASAAD